MNKGVIYGLICPLSNKVRYVGLTKKCPIKRLSAHITESKYYKKTGKFLNKKHNWLNKLINLGLDTEIKIEIIEYCDFDILSEREIYWISIYEELTNSTNGGDGVLNLSDDARRRISKANSGENNGMYGKRFKRSEQQRDNLSKSLINSDKLKESRNSKEYKDKLSKHFSIPILLLDMEYNIVMEFKSSKDCADHFGYTHSNISNAVRDIRKIGKGKKSKYWVVRKENYKESIKSIINKSF